MAITAVAIGATAAGTYVAGAAVTAGLVAAGGWGAALIAAGSAVAIGYAANEILGLTPDMPSLGNLDNASGLLTNEASPVAHIPVIYGNRIIGGTRVFIESAGDKNKDLYLVFALCEGEINGIQKVYFNDEEVFDPGTGVSYFNQTSHYTPITGSDYAGFAEMQVRNGTDTQTEFDLISDDLTSWTSDHKLSGVACVAFKLTYDKDAFASGLPNITFEVAGKKVYNPSDSTTAWSRNPALCLRDYLTNTRYGRGIPSSMIDDTSFTTAKTYCDDDVTIFNPSGGGSYTGPRYTCNGVVDTGQTSLTIVRELLSSCRGMLVFTGGKYRLIIDKVETASFSFDEDNIVGAWTISLGSKTNTYNRVKAQFFNPDRSWQTDVCIVDSETLRDDQDNGLILEREIQLPFTSDVYRSHAIATMALNQSRQQVMCSFAATIEATQCEVGDVVTVSHSTPGWVNKEFRVMSMSLRNNDEVEVALLEYDDDVYNYNAIDEVDSTPDTLLPDMNTVAAPSNLSAVASTYLQEDGTVRPIIEISWDDNDGFTQVFELRYKYGSGQYVSILTNDTDFTLYDIIVNQDYTIEVKAINGINKKSTAVTTNVSSTGDITAPDAPTNLAATAGIGFVTLDWDDNTESDLAGYQVWEHTSDDYSAATMIAKVSASSFTMGGLGYSATRYYWLKAYDHTGNVSSFTDPDGDSSYAGVSITTLAEPVDGDTAHTVYLYQSSTSGTTAPSAPSGEFTYTFSTKVLSGGTLNGWTQAIPSLTTNDYLWAIVATASSNSTTDTINASEFSTASVISYNPDDGDDGAAGYTTAIVNLYQKNSTGASAPSDPTGSFTYTFSTNTLAVIGSADFNGWSQTASSLAAGEFLWMIQATAYSNTSTDTIAYTEFSDARIIGIAGEDGDDGDPGTAGTRGTAGFVRITRTGNAPATPSGPTDAELATALGLSSASPITGDRANIIYADDAFSFYYSGSTWVLETSEFLNGNLIVAGSVGAGQINTSNLYVEHISVESASTGNDRLVIEDDVIKVIDSNNVVRVQIGNLGA